MFPLSFQSPGVYLDLALMKGLASQFFKCIDDFVIRTHVSSEVIIFVVVIEYVTVVDLGWVVVEGLFIFKAALLGKTPFATIAYSVQWG